MIDSEILTFFMNRWFFLNKKINFHHFLAKASQICFGSFKNIDFGFSFAKMLTLVRPKVPKMNTQKPKF